MEPSPAELPVREQTAEDKAHLLMQMLREKTALVEAELRAEAGARAEMAIEMVAELQAREDDTEVKEEGVIKKESEEPTSTSLHKPAGEVRVAAELCGNGMVKFSGLKGKVPLKRKRSDSNPFDNTSSDPAPPLPKKAKYPNANNGSVKTRKSKPPTSNNMPAITTSSTKHAPRVKAVYRSIKIVHFQRPDWYGNAQTKKTLARGDLEMIAKTREMIKSCLENRTGEEAERLFSKLRTRIHDMEFFAFLTPNGSNDENPGMAPSLIKKSRILEDDGLPKIFGGGPESDIFPFDIRADSEALWTRWMVEDFNPHLLRGIDTKKGILEKSGQPRTNYTMKQNYPHKRSANTLGENRLVNGQWWPSRRCAMRDGAHGEVEAGISGQADIGAFAICIAQGGYQDRDNGETIEYCGTQGKNGISSRGTKYLEETFRKDEPLRVLRAHKKDSKYAPKVGIRYDGLYKITDSEILEPRNVMKRFTLKRISGQDPIRYKGVEARPTQQEIVEMQKIRKYLS